MTELLLDPNIRLWVFLPIVIITFLVGIVRHYVSIILSSHKKIELLQVQDSQVMIRARLLRENGKYLPRQSFAMRRHWFNNEDTGYFKVQKRAAASQNPMTDPGMMTDMLKGNVTNVLPMIVIGGWINWMFSGFLTTKVPFPLTLRFKPMLQRGVELAYLDASWVSSASWYFLNVFGLRTIYTLVLGENNVTNVFTRHKTTIRGSLRRYIRKLYYERFLAESDPGKKLSKLNKIYRRTAGMSAADQSKVMQEQMSGAAMAMPPDPKAAFKAEWEALEITDHSWSLANVESDLLAIDRSIDL